MAREIEELRAEARHARERHALYRAKAYGQRMTSAARLRDLERAADASEARLRHALVAESTPPDP
ncbi:MAG: hypothetical protein ACR2ML_10635 [Solirubrobacteraceae bacterium]